MITFKALQGAAPNYITVLIKRYTPGRLLRPSNQCYFVHLSVISRLTVAGHLLLQHSLFRTPLNSSLDLVIPFLVLNLSLRLGLLKFLMMLPYKMMMFHRTMM